MIFPDDYIITLFMLCCSRNEIYMSPMREIQLRPNFTFKTKSGLSKHEKLPDSIRSHFLYNRIQSSNILSEYSQRKRKAKFVELITHKQLKHDLGMHPRNNNNQSTSVTLKLPEPENRKVPVKVSSKSNSEELCYFTDVVESSDNVYKIY